MSATEAEFMIGLLSELKVDDSSSRGQHIDRGTPSHNRLPVVLDAIANLLVSKKQHEVIAVSFQPRNKRATLKIAGNDTVPDYTLSHAKEIHRQLKNIGRQLFEHRSSPAVKESALPPHLQESINGFRRLTYSFSLPKLKQRLNKNHKGTSRVKAFIKYARSLPTPYNESMSLLQSIAKILGFVIHTLERYSGPPSEQDMEKLIDGLNLIRDDTPKLHEIPSWQFVLPKSDFLLQFPLDRFLKKICSVQNATTTLLKYAYSPSLYRQFLGKQKINAKRLGANSGPVHLPPHLNRPEMIKRVFARHHGEPAWQEMPEASKNGSSLVEKTGHVHCEAALAIHLISENTRNRSFPAVGYIGVSKLSCLVCFFFLKSLESAGYKFHTKGCHGKAYYPWKLLCMKRELSDQILETFCQKLEKVYVSRWKQILRRRLFDSSAKSGSSADSGDTLYKFSRGDLERDFDLMDF